MNELSKIYLNKIKYDDIPHELIKKYVPYENKITPFVKYLIEINTFEIYESGHDIFGIFKKSIYGIPENKFAKIESINPQKFKITYTIENLSEIEINMLFMCDFDFRLLDKLGHLKKSLIIDMNFTHSLKHVDECVNTDALKSGIYDIKNIN
jgi:hypothetical protein